MKNMILTLVSVFIGSLGQVFLKSGANKLNNGGALFSSISSLPGDLIRLITIPELVIGVIFFGTSFLMWVKVLTKADLSTAYPMVSLGYVLVAVLSFILFHESFSTSKIAGIAFIVIGAFLINR